MSVPQNQRQQGKFEVLNQAIDLADYTRNILKNKKNFPTENDGEYRIKKLRDAAENIYRYAWFANDMKVADRMAAIARDRFQARAIMECSELMININLAQKEFHMATKRKVLWIEMVEEVRKLLKAWRAADRKRYQEKYGHYDSS